MGDDLGKLRQRLRGARTWIKDRLGFTPIQRKVVYHRVTKTPWYYGDGAALLLLLIVLVTTGIFLALGYSPTTEQASQSVDHFSKQVLLGSFVRGLHYWSAGLMIVVLAHHLLRHVLFGGYLPPREGLWLIGVILLGLSVTNSFLGYTLPWDERGRAALRVALSIFHYVPLIGDELVVFVQGGVTPSDATLSRLLAVHTLFVPLGLLALTGYHLYLVVLHGETTVAERRHPVETAEEQRELRDRLKASPVHGTDFHPETASKSLAFGAVVFVLAAALAVTVGPPELDRGLPQEAWWFHWYSGLTALLPPWAAPAFHVAFPVLLFAVLVALPFVDHGANRGARRRPLAIISVVVIVVGLLALTGYRLKSPFTAWPRGELAPIPAGFELTAAARRGRELFTEKGCHACHAVGGHGPGFAPDLAALEVRLSEDELRRFLLAPPDGAAMPSYRGRATDEEIEALVAFVLVTQTFPRRFPENGP